jgi:hypothetical protein
MMDRGALFSIGARMQAGGEQAAATVGECSSTVDDVEKQGT